MGKMKKFNLFFIALSFFILNLDFIGYARPEVRKENAEKKTEDEKLIEAKAKMQKWEFSIATSLGLKVEPWIDNSLTTLTIAIPARIGYFLEDNMEIETEINFMYDIDHSKINTLFLANLAYNFHISPKVILFILGGAGFISMKEDGELQKFERSWIETYFVKNAGTGFKWFATKKVALRGEYRFINYKDNADNISYHTIFMGVSIFF